MIRRIQLENFKAWKLLKIEFGSMLTVLFGANSSGKSSVIHFLLMLQQTKNNSDKKRALDFGGAGKKVDLGDFDSVLHKGKEGNGHLKWTIDWKTDKPIPLYDTTGDSKEILIESDDFSIEVKVEGEEMSNSKGRVPKTRSLKYVVNGKYSFSIEPKNGSRSEFILKNDPDKFSFIRHRGRPWELTEPVKTHLFPDQAKTYFQNADLLRDLEYTYETQLIDNIYHLGPIRKEPGRYYRWEGVSPTDVGTEGQDAISAVLSAARDNEMRQKIKGRGNRQRPFQQAISEILSDDMELLNSFEVSPIGDGNGLFEVRVQNDEYSQKVLLPDVGIGVSQVLPAIVLLYYVPERSVVILEEPELHLHPRIQSNLADAIMTIATARNLQVIVESHSEHFLRRIQRRVAEDQYDSEGIKIYNVIQKEGEASLDPITLDKYGEIYDWPENFFGDEMEEIFATRKAALKRQIADKKRA